VNQNQPSVTVFQTICFLLGCVRKSTFDSDVKGLFVLKIRRQCRVLRRDECDGMKAKGEVKG